MVDPYFLFLTLTAICYILYRQTKLKKIKYRQSDIHKVIKNMLEPKSLNHPSRPSQSEKHAEKHNVRVIFVDGKAYWVNNNTFYCADVNNGDVDTESAMPIDVYSLDKVGINKLLFILDKLGDGSNNDSGSSGDQRL
jgi:hypothetical protein